MPAPHLPKVVVSLLAVFSEMHSTASALVARHLLSFVCPHSRTAHFNQNRLKPPTLRFISSMSSHSNTGDDQAALTEQLANELVNGRQSINTRPIKACIAIAGGGSNSASAIASTPGASSLLLESVVTYDRRSFAEFVTQNVDGMGEDRWFLELDSMDDTSSHSSGNGNSSADSNGSFHFCSAQAAVLLSKSALHRSLKLSPSFQDRCLNCVGVGSASSLVGLPSPNPDDNERRRKRRSRAYVACSSLRDGTMVWEVELCNGLETNGHALDLQPRRTRSQEEEVVSNLILAAMLKSSKLTNSETNQPLISQILKRAGDKINEKWFSSKNNNALKEPMLSPASGAGCIITGESNVVAVLPVEAPNSNKEMKALYADEQIPILSDVLIVPGSFNPPHIGHAQLANAAVAALQRIRQSEAGNSSGNISRSFHSMPSSLSSSSSVLNSIWSTVQTTSNEQYDPTVLFEISVTNVDKPPIDPDEVERRVNLFSSLKSSDLPKDWGVILTNAPLFSTKASLLDKLIDGIGDVRKMSFAIGELEMIDT